MMPLITLHKKYYNLIWLLYIFSLYQTIFFYRISFAQTSKLIDQMNDSIDENIGYKIFNHGSFVSECEYFKFLTGKYLAVFSEDIFFLFNRTFTGSHLFAATHNYYFLNPLFLGKIKDYYLFYGSNFLFFNYYASHFFIAYLKFFKNNFNFMISIVSRTFLQVNFVYKILYTFCLNPLLINKIS